MPGPLNPNRPFTHGQAVALMVLVTAMWSTAGVVTRHLEAARSFEVTFWRSAFTALSLLIILPLWQGAGVWRRIDWRSRSLWLSGLCWSVMFTAFMLALTLTTVANVLLTMAIGPLVTALMAWLWLGHRLPRRTWGAIAVAGAGIAWMESASLQAGGSAWRGFAVALCVPLAGAVQWTLMQQRQGLSQRAAVTAADPAIAMQIGAVGGDESGASAGFGSKKSTQAAKPASAVEVVRVSDRSTGLSQSAKPPSAFDTVRMSEGSAVLTQSAQPTSAFDMVPGVLLGGVLSALYTLPLACPLQASGHDLALLGVLGLFQLAIPCALAVVCASVLHAPEVSLLALLEVIFGIVLAWLGAGEAPGTRVLSGGLLVLGALAVNGWLDLRDGPGAQPPAAP